MSSPLPTHPNWLPLHDVPYNGVPNESARSGPGPGGPLDDKVEEAVQGFGFELRVRYEETDQGGVVYHANYFRYLEATRVELMRYHGISYADYERHGLRLMIVEASSRFHSPACFDDLLRITVTSAEIGPVRLDLEYQIHRLDPKDSPSKPGYPTALPEDAVLVTSARTLLANVHPDGRPRRLPPDLRERLRENS